MNPHRSILPTLPGVEAPAFACHWQCLAHTWHRQQTFQSNFHDETDWLESANTQSYSGIQSEHSISFRLANKQIKKLTRQASFCFSWIPCSITWSCCVSRSLSLNEVTPWDASFRLFNCFSIFRSWIWTRWDSAKSSLVGVSWRLECNIRCGEPGRQKSTLTQYCHTIFGNI